MGYTASKPTSASLCGIGLDYTQSNFNFLQQLIEHLTVNVVDSVVASGWQDNDPENIYLSGPVLALADSPGASSIYHAGAQYWNTTDKILYCYDTDGGGTWSRVGMANGLPASSTDNAIVRWDGATGATIQSSSASIDDSGNVCAPNIIASAKGLVLESIVANVTEASNIAALWFLDGTTTSAATTLADKSPYSGHTAASLYLMDNTFAVKAVTSCSPAISAGLCRYMTVDATTTFAASDAASFSFGDGLSDTPFSIITLMSPTFVAATDTPILSKYSAVGPNQEWLFYSHSVAPDVTASLFINMYSENGASYIICSSESDIVVDNSVWHVYACTYDGGGAKEGLTLYRDGVDVSSYRYTGGGYIATKGINANVGTHIVHSDGAIRTGTGSYAAIIILREELDGTQVKIISNILRAYAGVEIT